MEPTAEIYQPSQAVLIIDSIFYQQKLQNNDALEIKRKG